MDLAMVFMQLRGREAGPWRRQDDDFDQLRAQSRVSCRVQQKSRDYGL